MTVRRRGSAQDRISPEFIVIVPLEKVDWRFSGDHRSWPRHITLAPTFRHLGRVSAMTGMVRRVASWHEPFEVTFGPVTQEFGGEDAQAVVGGADQLRALHADLMDAIVNNNCEVSDFRYTAHGEGYNPHSSGEAALELKDPVGVWTVMILEKLARQDRQDGGRKKQIIEAIRLGEGSSEKIVV